MTNNELLNKLEEYGEYKRMLNEIKECLTAIEDEIKEEMNGDGEMTINGIKITNKTYIQQRFDSKAFKEEYGDLYGAYTKPIKCKRFKISF